MRILAISFLAMMLVIGVGPAIATPIHDIAKGPMDEMASHDFYLVSLTGKLLKGVDKVAGAPFELLEHPYRDVVVNGDYTFGLLTGISKGVYHTLETAGDGAKDILESPLP